MDRSANESGPVVELAPAAIDRGPRDWKGIVEFVAVVLVVFVRPLAANLLSLAAPAASGLGPEDTPPTWLLGRIPYEAGMAAILLVLLRSRDARFRPRPTPRAEWRRELLLGGALGFGLFFVGFAFAYVLHRLGVPSGTTPWATFFRNPGARAVFSIETLFAATYEEVAFRAYLQGRLEEWMPRRELFAVVLSAGAFALMHGYAPAGTLGIYLFGMLQGYAYRRWRRIPRLAVAHAFSNLLTAWL